MRLRAFRYISVFILCVGAALAFAEKEKRTGELKFFSRSIPNAWQARFILKWAQLKLKRVPLRNERLFRSMRRPKQMTWHDRKGSTTKKGNTI